MIDTNTLEDVYQHLKGTLPEGIPSRLDYVDSVAAELSHSSLLQIRQICFLHSLLKTSKDKNQLFTPFELLNSVVVPPEESLSIYAPLDVQSLASFLAHIFSKPADLAEQVLHQLNSPTFKHLIHYTIPAIFSFYVTRESATFAYNFYTAISRLVPLDSFITIVAPFFNTAAVIHFASKLFHDMYWSNYLCTPGEYNFIQQLLDKAAKHILFLPVSNLALLKILRVTYSETEIWRLLIDDLLIPQLYLQSRLSPFSYITNWKHDIDRLSSLLKSATSSKSSFTLPHLTFEGSLFEIPDAFIASGNAFSIEIVYTQTDIQLLSNLGFDVPHHAARLKRLCETFKGKFTLDSAFLRVYPKFPRPPDFGYRPFLFNLPPINPPPLNNIMNQVWCSLVEIAASQNRNVFDILKSKPIRTGSSYFDVKLNSDFDIEGLQHYGLQTTCSELVQTANFFEQLLDHSLSVQKIQRWQMVICSGADALSAHIAHSHFFNPKAKNIFDELEKVPQIFSVKFWLAMYYLDKNEASILAPHMDAINEMERLMRKVCYRRRGKISTSPALESGILTCNMWGMTGLLSFVDAKSSLFARFVTLNEYYLELQRLAEAAGFVDDREKVDELLFFTLATNNYIWVLRTMMFLQGVLFSDERFINICEHEMAERWQKLTVAFFQFISDDVDLVSQYGQYATGGLLHLP